MELETPPFPPPFMEKSFLNFHFDYWKISLRNKSSIFQGLVQNG